MDQNSREALFDDWAANYDFFVANAKGFPFEGYQRVLGSVVASANPQAGQRILDLGSGTGGLSALFAAEGCDVTGVDFSHDMLKRAIHAVPSATFLHLDLLGKWDAIAGRRFDHIVSAFVLHEFEDETKRRLMVDIARDHLAPGGVITIGDIAFSDQAHETIAQAKWAGQWDPDEHYWIADRAMGQFQEVGLIGDYHQATPFAGVFRFAVEG